MKAFLLVVSAGFLLAASPTSAQFPMDGTPGGPQKMKQAEILKEKIEEKVATRMEGEMDRAIHRMKVKEKKELNAALVERGSLVLADGAPIKANEDAGEQVIDPRTPKGFGNPFFRAIHVEQNIKVNDLLTEFEQKELARLKWQENEDVKANATEEISAGAGWTPVIARGEMKTPAVRAPEFMAYLEVSPNKIIRRICQSCDDPDFKDIYYRRLTNTYTRSLRTMLEDGPFDTLNEYKGTSNMCFQDFILYSTYEDAINNFNSWSYCLPSARGTSGKNVGFPSYSGPNGRNEDNYNQGGAKQPDYAFYVETPDWIPTAGTYRLDIKGSRDGEDIEKYHIDKINEYLDLSPNRIARRVCNDCVGKYRDVYFRHTPPAGMSVNNVEYFLLESFQPFGVENFEFRQDFNIYSTYEDAIAEQNAWEHCDWLPAKTYGFPGLCRPKRSDPVTPAQWTRYDNGGTIKCDHSKGKCARDTCLYIEAAEEDKSPDREAWMSDDEEMELFFYGKKDALPECLDEGQAQNNNLGNGAMTPHGLVSVDQKYHSATWWGNPAETYDGARNFCRSKGMDLCPRSKVCPNGAGGAPDGGTRSGDQWVPVLDEHNQWVQVANWGNAATVRRELWDGTIQQQPTYTPTYTCMTHEEVVGSRPVWGLYGQDAYDGSMNFLDRVMCCGVEDTYQFDDYAGYYDVRRCGSCHDYCFWMSVDGTTYNPPYEAGSNPWHTPIAYDTNGAVKAFFTCNLSGSSSGEISTGLDFLMNEKGVMSFPYQKCAFEGQHTHNYRKEEYMGCYKNQSPEALPELVGDGQFFSFSKCADACASRNYHYFGRTGNGQCRCGGRTRDDYTFNRYGLIPYGSSPAPSPTPSSSVFYDAVDGANSMHDINIKTSADGYTGSGYADFGKQGAFLEFTTIDGGAGGPCTLNFRYSQGGSDTRPCALTINSQLASVASSDVTVYFPNTDDWGVWRNDIVETTCEPGINRIRLTAITGDGGPNLDNVVVTMQQSTSASDYCNCNSDNAIGNGMCTYRIVDQFDPNTARKYHPCRYLPAQDMRKMCYIACRDGSKNLANKLTCKMMETMGRTYLSKMINKHYDKGGKQLHMLGGDTTTSGTALGTF